MSGGGAGPFTVADLDRFLGDRSAPAEVRPYLDAASVLAAFDPDRLRPAGGVAKGAPTSSDVSRELRERSLPLEDAPEGWWVLTLPERRTALSRLIADGEASSALAANPDRLRTPVQDMFERVLRGPTVPLSAAELASELSRGELAALLGVDEWAGGLLVGLPARSEIESALARVDLLDPLERLAGQGFVGRRGELDELRRHVFSTVGTPPPVFVHGPGGIGKSTLIARFLLDTVKHRGPAAVFAYVDLDVPAVRPDEPVTLLLRILRQLELQLDFPPGQVSALAKDLAASLRRLERERLYEYVGSGGAESARATFAQAVRLALGGRTLLLAVDTVEEAQYLGEEVVLTLLQFLHGLARELPALRLVLCGRALPRAGAWDHGPDDLVALDLDTLDPASARLLVRDAAAGAGPELTDDELDDVVDIVGRNTMCLKLAGRLVRDEGVERLRATRSQFLMRLRAEKVQALLYGRILRHLHSDEARAVAYPGLVVRRIDPEVIGDVLAGPCQLRLRSDHDEWAVFSELAREVALVERDADGSLRHRPDVRRAMLEGITDHVAPETVADIDRAAVAFYTRRKGAVARAEEIYHRLRLREPEIDLENRWSPEAADYLKSAGEELPPRERLWLAAKLGVSVEPAVRQAADDESWEQQAVGAAERLLSSGNATEALQVLHERTARSPRGRVRVLEADALRQLDRTDEAAAVARAGADAAAGAGAVDLALEHLLHLVVIEEGRGRITAAEAAVEEAAQVAEHSSDPMLRFRVDVTGLRIRRRLGMGTDLAKSAEVVAASLTDDLLRDLRERPVLLREAAAELTPIAASLAAEAMQVLGAEVDDDQQAEAFGHALRHAADSDVLVRGSELVLGADLFERDDFDPSTIREWVANRLTGRGTRELGRSLGRIDADSGVLEDFQTYFQAGVDHSLRADEG